MAAQKRHRSPLGDGYSVEFQLRVQLLLTYASAFSRLAQVGISKPLFDDTENDGLAGIVRRSVWSMLAARNRVSQQAWYNDSAFIACDTQQITSWKCSHNLWSFRAGV